MRINLSRIIAMATKMTDVHHRHQMYSRNNVKMKMRNHNAIINNHNVQKMNEIVLNAQWPIRMILKSVICVRKVKDLIIYKSRKLKKDKLINRLGVMEIIFLGKKLINMMGFQKKRKKQEKNWCRQINKRAVGRQNGVRRLWVGWLQLYLLLV